MNFVSGSVTFIIVWWIVFYMTLPLYVKRQEKVLVGNDTGAPEKTYLLKKVLLTTFLSVLILAGLYYLSTYKSAFFYDLIMKKGALS